MRPLFVNETTYGLIQGFRNPEKVRGVASGLNDTVESKRGDSTTYGIQFGTPFGSARELATPLELRFGAKVHGDNDGSYVVSNYDSGSGLFAYELQGSGATATYLAALPTSTKLNNLLGYDPQGFAEVTEIRCLADVAASLDGKYFVLRDAAGSVGVWFDVDNNGTTVPAGASACTRTIEVTGVVTGDTAEDVAEAVATALEADAAFTAEAAGRVVTITDAAIGARTAAADGNTSFNFRQWIAGSAPLTMTNVPYVDLDAEIRVIEDGVTTATLTFTYRVYFDINNDGGNPAPANPLFPAPGLVDSFAAELADLTPSAVTAANLFSETLFGTFYRRIIPTAGAGAFTAAYGLPVTSMKTGATVEVNIELPASSNPTVEVRNATSGGTLLATVTSPTPAALTYWYGRFRFNGTAWKKIFAAFQ